MARMRRETLHSTMKATMKEVRRDVMFCSITEILSAMADFTSAASVARRAARRLELFSSSSNHPTSFLRIAEAKFDKNKLVDQLFMSISKVEQISIAGNVRIGPRFFIPASIILLTLVVRFSPMILKK